MRSDSGASHRLFAVRPGARRHPRERRAHARARRCTCAWSPPYAIGAAIAGVAGALFAQTNGFTAALGGHVERCQDCAHTRERAQAATTLSTAMRGATRTPMAETVALAGTAVDETPSLRPPSHR